MHNNPLHNKVVINWMNGAWGSQERRTRYSCPWCGGPICAVVPRTEENDWCRHIFRESSKAADTHANWLMDNGDSGPGAQWMAPDLHDKIQKSRHILCCLLMGPEGKVDLVRLRGFCGYGMNMVSLRRSPMVVAC